MSSALVTALLLSLAGLVTSLVLGHAAGDAAGILRHTTLAVFVTLITLLAHSMTMFYLIGKGKAVREAVTEAQLPAHFVRQIYELRRPVFSMATLAMALTMAAAILGGGVDTGAVPSAVHTLLAYTATAANVAALRVELRALAGSARVVADVNRALGV